MRGWSSRGRTLIELPGWCSTSDWTERKPAGAHGGSRAAGEAAFEAGWRGMPAS